MGELDWSSRRPPPPRTGVTGARCCCCCCCCCCCPFLGGDPGTGGGGGGADASPPVSVSVTVTCSEGPWLPSVVPSYGEAKVVLDLNVIEGTCFLSLVRLLNSFRLGYFPLSPLVVEPLLLGSFGSFALRLLHLVFQVLP